MIPVHLLHETPDPGKELWDKQCCRLCRLMTYKDGYKDMSGFQEKIITVLKEAALILVLGFVLVFAINALRPGGSAIIPVHTQSKWLEHL